MTDEPTDHARGHASLDASTDASAHGSSEVSAAAASVDASVVRGRPWSRRRVLRLVFWATVMLLAVLVPLVVRVLTEGRAELARAQEMEAYGTFDDQVLHLGRAARWRLPVASHDDLALAKLMALGEAHQAVGADGVEPALAAYREVRRALLATRTFGVSDPPLLKTANERIAALMAQQEQSLGMDLSQTGDRQAHHLSLLENTPGPDPLGGRVSALVFIAWAAASITFVLLGVDARGRLRVRQATRWGFIALALLVAWLLVMGT